MPDFPVVNGPKFRGRVTPLRDYLLIFQYDNDFELVKARTSNANMFSVILILIIITASIAAIFRPFIGLCAYYVLATLSPQYIWPWIFNDIRASFIISIATLVGTAIAIATRQADPKRLKNRQTYCIVGIWALIHISNIVTQYSGFPIPRNMISPDFIIEIFNTILVFYLLAIILVDTTEKLRGFSWVLIFTALYFIYWANMVYLTGDMWKHQIDGRLKGPGSIYTDTNAFSLFFVISQPLIFYMGLSIKNLFLKYGLWLAIPFLWHAVFLTGSRGGLLSLFVVTLFMAISLKSKGFSILLIAALIIALVDQGQNVLDRTESTIEKQQTITDQEPLDPRIKSWKIGIQMMLDNPIFGVGVGRFQQASLDHGSSSPHVAHNTFLQLSAGSGVLAGFMYLFIFYHIFSQYFRYKKPISLSKPSDFPTMVLEATTTALIGFFVGSIFLDLLLFESFYYLLALWLSSFTIKKMNPIITT